MTKYKIINPILYIILLFMLLCLYIYYDRIQIKLYLNSLKKIPIIKYYNMYNGPYILEDGTKIFEYNPSIYNYNGDVIYISRLSGHVYIDRLNTCNKIFNKYKFDKTIDNAFKIFPKHIRNKCSHSIIKNLTTNETKIIPFNIQHLKHIKISNDIMGCEDPRLFKFNNKHWVYFHYIGRDNLYNKNKISKYITITPLDNLNNFIYLYTDKMKRTEKNWMPFEYNNELYFEYSIQPHTILKAELDKNKNPIGYCKKIYETKTKYSKKRHFGGGSPSVKIKLNGTNYYLGITHTRGKTGLLGLPCSTTIRKNVFYLFRAEPPFDILWLSNEFNMLDTPINIEFATGLIVKNNKNSDNIEDYTVIVSYGVEDCYGSVNEYRLCDILKYE